MRNLRITVEGKTYDVTVEVLGETPAAAPAPAAAPVSATPVPAAQALGAEPPAGPAAANVVSQLAGTVVSVEVTIGQAVNAGDALLVIEAMKMNTPVGAPRAGTVSAIAVTPGAVIEEGQVLVTLA